MKQQASQFVTALEMVDGTDIPYVHIPHVLCSHKVHRAKFIIIPCVCIMSSSYYIVYIYILYK